VRTVSIDSTSVMDFHRRAGAARTSRLACSVVGGGYIGLERGSVIRGARQQGHRVERKGGLLPGRIGDSSPLSASGSNDCEAVWLNTNGSPA